MVDVIEHILDPFLLKEWIDTIVSILSLIPAPMGVLLTIAVLTAVIRAVL